MTEGIGAVPKSSQAIRAICAATARGLALQYPGALPAEALPGARPVQLRPFPGRTSFSQRLVA